jgi:hypothetical protein
VEAQCGSPIDPGIPPPRQSVHLSKIGAGSIWLGPSEVCGAECKQVDVQLRSGEALEPRAATGSYFVGWTGNCSVARERICTITEGTTDLTATFAPLTANLVFVSSRTFTPDLGSPAAYDAECNTLATAAGLNTAQGDAFIAWLSDSTSDAKDRLGTATGFVRIDGKGFLNDLSEMMQGKIRNPLDIDEHGEEVRGAVYTATDNRGMWVTDNACGDWSGAPGSGLVLGLTYGGPHDWTAGEGATCDEETRGRLYCFMHTLHTTLSPPNASGKIIFISTTSYLPGANPDQVCEHDKPAGAGPVKALLTRTDRSLASMLEANQRYMRPDGEEIGLGSDIIGGTLRSGIWQRANGQYSTVSVWTGVSSDPTEVGTPSSTCHDWTVADGSLGARGYPGVTTGAWAGGGGEGTVRCDDPAWLYCVEQ